MQWFFYNLSMKFSAMEINKKVIDSYKKNIPAFLLFGFLTSISSSVVYLQDSLSTSAFFLIVIVSFLLSFLAHGALFWFVYQKDRGQSVTVMQSFNVAASVIWKLLAVNILFVGITFIGGLLFIVPGIMWGLLFSQAATFVVLKKQGVHQSFDSSKHITNGNRWRMVDTYIVLGLPIMLIGLLIDSLAWLNEPLVFVLRIIFFIVSGSILPLVTYYLWDTLTKQKSTEK